uniref:Large ribosomal subunit protein mL52 n=2 Tax=Clastoptera arizonana TaxID=38151 RepID=A0A1B6CH11_9HEMI
MSLRHCSLRTFPKILSVTSVVHIPSAKTHRQKVSKWSMEIPTRNIIPNPNTNRILLDTPDYSYLDKRPVPYTSGQYMRLCLQREYTKKIIDLTKELDYAKERFQNIQKEKIEEEQRVLRRKLNPKGGVLRKKETELK